MNVFFFCFDNVCRLKQRLKKIDPQHYSKTTKYDFKATQNKAIMQFISNLFNNNSRSNDVADVFDEMSFDEVNEACLDNDRFNNDCVDDSKESNNIFDDTMQNLTNINKYYDKKQQMCNGIVRNVIECQSKTEMQHFSDLLTNLEKYAKVDFTQMQQLRKQNQLLEAEVVRAMADKEAMCKTANQLVQENNNLKEQIESLRSDSVTQDAHAEVLKQLVLEANKSKKVWSTVKNKLISDNELLSTELLSLECKYDRVLATNAIYEKELAIHRQQFEPLCAASKELLKHCESMERDHATFVRKQTKKLQKLENECKSNEAQWQTQFQTINFEKSELEQQKKELENQLTHVLRSTEIQIKTLKDRLAYYENQNNFNVEIKCETKHKINKTLKLLNEAVLGDYSAYKNFVDDYENQLREIDNEANVTDDTCVDRQNTDFSDTCIEASSPQSVTKVCQDVLSDILTQVSTNASDDEITKLSIEIQDFSKDVAETDKTTLQTDTETNTELHIETDVNVELQIEADDATNDNNDDILSQIETDAVTNDNNDDTLSQIETNDATESVQDLCLKIFEIPDETIQYTSDTEKTNVTKKKGNRRKRKTHKKA